MELETINKLYIELTQIITATTARDILLQKQLAEAQRDAERWRWLRDHARIFRQSPDMSGNHYWVVQTTTTLRGPTLDAAIDNAAHTERFRAAIDAAKGGGNA